MAGETLIYTDNPGPLPKSYVFPASLDARLYSVSATFDGSGASGTFMPCLSVYSQDDKLIGRFFPGGTVAAGDSAEVTFAPFLGGDTAAAASASLPQTWMRRTSNLVITDASIGAIGGFGANDGDVPGTFTLDTLAGTIAVHRTGIYAVTVSCQWLAADVPVAPALLRAYFNSTVDGAVYPFSEPIYVLWQDAINPPGMLNLTNSSLTTTMIVNFFYKDVGDASVQLVLGQSSGVNKTMDSCAIAIVRLGDSFENP